MAETDGRVIKVLIGQVALSRAPNRLEAVLGSCIGLVLYQRPVAVAGMAHILLPDSAGRDAGKLVGKYANQAVPCLLQAMLRYGAKRADIRAKFAGGSRMFTRSLDYRSQDVGTGNIEAVRAALHAHGLDAGACEVGGDAGRKVTFDIASNQLVIERFDGRRQVL
ncbi:MAG: chemotaxis protein CheD [Planctomycetota bacterium]